MKTVKITFMGPARQFNEQGFLEFEVEVDATIQTIREKLQQSIDENFLPILKTSVFATEQNLLTEEEKINDGAQLVLIPPISGG